jgi:hypothetical protein
VDSALTITAFTLGRPSRSSSIPACESFEELGVSSGLTEFQSLIREPDPGPKLGVELPGPDADVDAERDEEAPEALGFFIAARRAAICSLMFKAARVREDCSPTS